MQFEKGQSGNPNGRPLGSRNKSTMLLQNLLDGEAEAIARKVIEMAKAGDMAAIRVCLDRLAPARRSASVTCELPPLDDRGGTMNALSTIIAAVGAGDITPAEAASLAKVIELHQMARSIVEYEQRQAAKNAPK
jgi:uncharacterized protein DUF5681